MKPAKERRPCKSTSDNSLQSYFTISHSSLPVGTKRIPAEFQDWEMVV